MVPGDPRRVAPAQPRSGGRGVDRPERVQPLRNGDGDDHSSDPEQLPTNPPEMTPADEISPYLVVRVRDGSAEFARWRVADGADAVALFLTAENAEAYARTAVGGPG